MLSRVMRSFVFLFVITLIAVQTAPRSVATEPKVIRFMYQRTLFTAPIYIAIKKGWYDQALQKVGYKVEYSSSVGGNPILEAMAAGKVDIGDLGTSVAVSGVGRGVPLKIVMTTNIGGESIVVPATSSINKIADLKGHKVGIQGKGTMQDFILHKALADNNVPFSDVQVVEIPAPDLAGTLERGQIDAATLWEPVGSNLVVNHKGRVLEYGQQIWPQHDNESPAATDKAIKEDPQAVRAIVQETVRGLHYCAQHATECQNVVAQELNLSNAVIQYAWNHTVRPKDGMPNEKDLEVFANQLYAWGLINRKLSANDIVDTEFLH